MRLISYNVNGIRAAMKKGFCEWLQTDPADIVCVQETKAQHEYRRFSDAFRADCPRNQRPGLPFRHFQKTN